MTTQRHTLYTSKYLCIRAYFRYILYGIFAHSTLLYSTLPYSTLLYFTLLYSTLPTIYIPHPTLPRIYFTHLQIRRTPPQGRLRIKKRQVEHTHCGRVVVVSRPGQTVADVAHKRRGRERGGVVGSGGRGGGGGDSSSDSGGGGGG